MARTRSANIGGMLITANGMVSSSGVDLASQANAAYGQANNSYAQANLAYGQANSAYNAANTKLSSSGGTISGSLTVSGDLIVEGNTVTLNVATLEIEDNDIVLNANTTSTPTLNASITVDRGTSTNTFLRWNENTDKWGWSDDGTNLYNFSVALDAYAQANAAYAQANTGGNTSNLVAKTGDTMTGNLTFSGTGLRILGDMSNATWNNRLAFQTSTANGSTALLVIPNGTATISQYTAWGNTDLTNASYVQLVQLGATETRLGAGIQGTGTYTPITVYTGGSERMRLDTSGNLLFGTTSTISTSAAKFQLAGSGVTAGLTLARTDAPTSGASFVGIDAWANDGSAYVAGGTINFRAAENWTSTNHGTDIQFRTTASGSGGALAERMRITSNGNIGIGTSAPTNFGGTNLSIHSPSSSTYASQLWVSGAYVMEALINEGSSVMSFGSRSNHRLDLVSNDTTRMSITTGGDVGIGTTSASFNGATSRLFVQKSGFEVLGLNNGNNTNQSWIFAINDSGLGSAGRFNICQIVNGSTGGIGGGPAVPIISCEVPSAASTVPRLLINAAGNVGIGTSSPSARLHVLTANPTAANEVARFQGGSNSSNYRNYITLYTTNPSYWWEFSNQDASGGGTQNGLAFIENSAGTATTRMYLTSGGNVGIGTTSPQQKLHVVASTSTGTTGIRVDGQFGSGYFGTYANYPAIMYDSSGLKPVIVYDTNNNLNLLYTSNTERMRIDGSGNITFGSQMKTVTSTASSAGGTTGNSAGFNHAGVFIDRGWSDYPGMSVCNQNAAGNGQQGQFRFHGTNCSYNSYPSVSGGDFSVQIWSDGGFYDASDRRFKRNITTIPNALDKVLSMTGRRFQFINSDGVIEEQHTQNGFRFGFVAQELQDAGIDEVYRYHPEDDDGTEGYNKAYAVHYGSVTALLVEAIKELKADNDSLRSRLEALENK